MSLPVNLNPVLGPRLVSDCWISAPSIDWTGWEWESREPPKGAHRVRALWDTGCDTTHIQRRIVETCQLQPIEGFLVGSMWRPGAQIEHSFELNLGLPGGIVASRLRVLSRKIFDEIDMIIGMDIILRVGLLVVPNTTREPLVRFHAPPVKSP